MAFRGLFVGLITLDMVYQVERMPQPNQKCVALDSAISAGGPATNAAVAFSALGNQATVLGGLGQHPIQHLIRQDLEECGVAIADLLPHQTTPPPASSIMVTKSTGDRAVVSLNAVKSQATPEQIPAAILSELDRGQFDVVLIDGHQMAVGEAIAHRARQLGIPVIVDGGSWKPRFETVLRHTDVAICSANFQPPHCSTSAEVMNALAAWGITHRVITRGEQPILYESDQSTMIQISTTPASVVDTLGAGDIFHGAFCHHWLQQFSQPKVQQGQPFPAIAEPEMDAQIINALEQAGVVAAQACQSFGTRQWLRERL
ncbi:MAG: PfkB family carbohydrate kinase [Elainellaceae cyanobacterium]